VLRKGPLSGAAFIRSSIILNWERNIQLVMVLKSDSGLIGGLVTRRSVLGLLDSSDFGGSAGSRFPVVQGGHVEHKV
jgi:hypothetical protein